ncbi:MAG: alpha/beta hydrolase [Bacteroidia bacterium]
MEKLLFIFFCIVGYISSSQTVTINTDLAYKVNLPSQKTCKAPVIIMLHGYGSNEGDLFELAKSLDPWFITFSLRAPFAANGQGYCWYKLDFLPQKQFRHDYNQAKQSREKILSFISNACKAYKADSSQVFILGFSQGAIMSYELVLSKPEKIKGVIALSGLLLEETKKIKFDGFKVANVKFFIAHGTMDNVIDYKKGEEAASYLQSKKNNVTFKSYDMPHTITGKELDDIKSWLTSNISIEKNNTLKK